MKCKIHKNKIYITPRPKKDIKNGLIIKLNKSLFKGAEPFMFNNIFENQKEYELPDLPEGIYIEFAFIKEK